ncbi:hypothetical protein DL93DRAFT_2090278 [Clavulina sp. PMI_390]|nr:hypothetical protein DL93DRAFT_2090278 [Clavulina sp. PMI_390]
MTDSDDRNIGTNCFRHGIIQACKSSMMTTRTASGALVSRAMAPASCKNESLHFNYIANNTSGKFEELQHDPHVNVSFFDPSTTNWISVSGTAKLISDRSVVKQYWSSSVKAWFGDLGDGVRTGDESDPRVSVIEVIPDQITFWEVTRGKVGRAVDIAASAVTGNVASPGALHTITKDEIALVEGLHSSPVQA